MCTRPRNRSLLVAVALIALGATLALSGCLTIQTPPGPSSSPNPSSATSSGSGTETVTKAQAAYAADWRRAWAEQALWTRLVILSQIDGTPGGAQAQTRLLRNPRDMADLMKPYYGQSDEQALGDLMTRQLQTTISFVEATNAGNPAEAAALEKTWYGSTAEISAFLAGKNPNLDQTAVNNLLKQQVALTKQEALDRLTKDYTSDVGDFDAIQARTLVLSDTISSAIVQQFPDKFK